VRRKWSLCLITLPVALLVGMGSAESHADKKVASGNPAKTAVVHSDTRLANLAGRRVRQPSQQSPGGRERRHVSDKSMQRTRAPLANNNGTESASNAPGRFTSANDTNAHQSLLSRSDLAARQAAFQRETMNSALPVRPVTAVRTGGPPPANVRYHGPNPAVIGGPMSATARNTSVLSGSAMHRRP
jgi:hypothetical protein